jgi:ATP-dependent Clp protease ATP-binding subunit ClpA
MDVDNRGLEDGGGRDDEESGFSEGGSGLPDDASDYLDEAVSRADAEAGDNEATAGETESEETQYAAESSPEEREEPNLPDDVYEIDPSPHSLLSVLFPAKPPRPRNARVIRLFDLEAAKHDGEPGEEPVVEQPPKEEARTREAIRAARNQSLLVAARLR